jgi:hypothetical protein
MGSASAHDHHGRLQTLVKCMNNLGHFNVPVSWLSSYLDERHILPHTLTRKQ